MLVLHRGSSAILLFQKKTSWQFEVTLQERFKITVCRMLCKREYQGQINRKLDLNFDKCISTSSEEIKGQMHILAFSDIFFSPSCSFCTVQIF